MPSQCIRADLGEPLAQGDRCERTIRESAAGRALDRRRNVKGRQSARRQQGALANFGEGFTNAMVLRLSLMKHLLTPTENRAKNAN